MQIQSEKHYYTRTEYLALEEVAEYKSEYRDGEIFPMTGGTTNHNQIVGNIYANLKSALKGRNYRLFFSDVRLWIPRYRLYTYPDIMIIHGEPIYDGVGTTTVTNPTMIFEVLSKSTQSYDKSDKFRYYRSIPTFKDYILIDQYSYYVEHFYQNEDGKWELTEYEFENALLSLTSMNIKITFSDIYELVDFNNIS